MCAGEGDVTAAGAAEQRDHDGNEFLGILRGKDMDDRIADGGLGHKSHDQHCLLYTSPSPRDTR